jgi:Dyp-type peroxidase family
VSAGTGQYRTGLEIEHMPSSTAVGVTVDLANVQGIIHHFYARPAWRHLLFHFNDPAAGRQFLKSLVPLVTAADAGASPAKEQLLNVGLTATGLAALGVTPEVLEQFPLEFREAPDPVVMGDFDESDTKHWWNGKFATPEIHAIVHLFCNSLPALEAWTSEIRKKAGGGIVELIPTVDGQPITGGLTADHRLHFGYRDGISQPEIAWADGPTQPDQLNFRNFLLGYSTAEINSSPQFRPSKPAESRTATSLAQDGTYSIFRWLYQDVARFNRFLADEAPKLAAPGQTPAEAQELLAAKLLGRWRDGTPLVLSPYRPDPTLADFNDFKYRTADPDGQRCPVSAHIRVTNPRDDELNDFEGPVPRVIRRGTPFGDRLEGSHDDGHLRGLAGMFFCASIAGQFYKMTSWMKTNNFSPQYDGHVTEQDPLSNRNVPEASRDFRIPTDRGTVTIQLQDFTRTLGTAFFLIPGLAALRQLAR